MDRKIIEDLGNGNKEVVDYWKQMMLDDFDNFYDYVLLEDLHEFTPDRIINTFETFDSLVFGSDNVSILKFCWKMIQRIKNDKKNGLADYPKVARELLSEYTERWHETKKWIEFGPQYEKIIEPKTTTGKKKKELQYKDLFNDQQKADDLKNILKNNGYLDENYKWVGQTGDKNELAIAYYILRELAHNFQIIKLGSKKPQLIVFYQEFGLQVSEKSDESAYTSIRNITKEPTERDTHDVFKKLFKPLVKNKN